MIKSQITNNFSETQLLGQHLGTEILAMDLKKNATILALKGDLGSGKTTFLQGLAVGLGIKEVVNSPTFVIMKSFALRALSFKKFYHFDLYRLENDKDVEFLNFKEIISDSKNIVAIEWPEKIDTLLPKDIILIDFKHLEENKREILIKR